MTTNIKNKYTYENDMIAVSVFISSKSNELLMCPSNGGSLTDNTYDFDFAFNFKDVDCSAVFCREIVDGISFRPLYKKGENTCEVWHSRPLTGDLRKSFAIRAVGSGVSWNFWSNTTPNFFVCVCQKEGRVYMWDIGIVRKMPNNPPSLAIFPRWNGVFRRTESPALQRTWRVNHKEICYDMPCVRAVASQEIFPFHERYLMLQAEEMAPFLEDIPVSRESPHLHEFADLDPFHGEVLCYSPFFAAAVVRLLCGSECIIREQFIHGTAYVDGALPIRYGDILELQGTFSEYVGHSTAPFQKNINWDMEYGGNPRYHLSGPARVLTK